MNPEKDYTHRTWLAAVALLAVLGGVSLIPPCTVGGVALRRANILSDLVRFEEAAVESPSQVVLDEEEFRVDLTDIAAQIEAADTLVREREVRTTFEWRAGTPDSSLMACAAPVPEVRERIEAEYEAQSVVPVEDFDTTGRSPLHALYAKLLDGRDVRIAVLGDSFIEGDILTADLRERLQEHYGGCGAGFAPMASPLANFRRTVKTQARGWTPYNIMQYKTTPQALRDRYYVSGWVCQAAPGAQTRWECSDARQRLDPCLGARILFVSRGDSRAEVTLNDTLRRVFDIEGDEALRQIAVSGIPIRSLAFRVAEGADGFIGYGALLEGPGVGVDNYSVRSNNGQAMFRTDPAINAQAGAMLGYDLVVLQYGLNIMQQGIRNYDNYGAKVCRMIAYVRECFPRAAVLVLGVSDRSVRTDAGFEPMDALPFMTACQRAAARSECAAFWDTAAAMRALGGMERFVRSGWAGKDYTHINYGGGRQVARALAAALHEGVRRAAERREFERRLELMRMNVADSLGERMVRSALFTPPAPIE